MLAIAVTLVALALVALCTREVIVIPGIVFLQAAVICAGCLVVGMAAPLVALAFVVQALTVPLLLYYTISKSLVSADDAPVIGFPLLMLCALAAFAAAYLLSRQLGCGPFTLAAVFTALVGVIVAASRRTIVCQLAGFVLLQNGIFALTSSLAVALPPVLEIVLAVGVLLTVLIMVYAVRAMHRSCGSVAVTTFSALRG